MERGLRRPASGGTRANGTAVSERPGAWLDVSAGEGLAVGVVGAELQTAVMLVGANGERLLALPGAAAQAFEVRVFDGVR